MSAVQVVLKRTTEEREQQKIHGEKNKERNSKGRGDSNDSKKSKDSNT